MKASKITLKDVSCSWGHDGVKELCPFDSPKTVVLERKLPVFLTGDNGTGKTSFLKSVLGMVPQVTGTVAITLSSNEEKTCALSKFTDWKFQTVYVPQKASEMFPSATLVRTATRVWARLGRRSGADDEILEFADTLGIRKDLVEILDARVETLSGGEAHLLSLFLAALRNPTLILLDEPTAAVSQMRKEMVINLVLKLTALPPDGCFMIVATHDTQLIGASTRLVAFK